SGYLNKDVLNPFVSCEGSTWYQTGDLGKLDSSGNLTLSGRMKRFVKVGGEMLSLTAIEEVFSSLKAPVKKKALPEVPQVAVCATLEDGNRPKLILFTVPEI